MADRSRITVDATKRKYPTGDLYGIFFEDINHAADGGLYAEMIQNRSFEFSPIDNRSYNNMTAWQIVERDGGRAEGYVESEYPLNVNNTHYFRIRNIAEGAVGAVGVMNEGYNTGLPL
ncbi:MAG TPA: alpha-L-arabinofuranosidase, partial [Bacillota bacterium]|nr:alpha-L-arabinofuranosidase [Bacillota bacterium]